MCDPVSLTIAATAVAAAGKGMGALQDAASYRYQAKIADRNAQLTQDASHMAQDNARTEALRLGRKVGQTEGSQNAAMAANGVDLGFGSAAQVQDDTKMLANEDYTQLYRQGFQDVRGYDISAWNDRSKAKAARQAASGAIMKGIFDVAGTVLGGAQQVSKMGAAAK